MNLEELKDQITNAFVNIREKHSDNIHLMNKKESSSYHTISLQASLLEKGIFTGQFINSDKFDQIIELLEAIKNFESNIEKEINMDKTELERKKKDYVLNSIYCTDYSEKTGEVEINDQLTTKGKLQYVANNLKGEAFHEYNEKRFRSNAQNIIADHMMGLPSYLNVDFENYKILEIAKEWGYTLSSEEKEDEFLEQWFPMMSKKLLELMNENGIDVRGDNTNPERVDATERAKSFFDTKIIDLEDFKNPEELEDNLAQLLLESNEFTTDEISNINWNQIMKDFGEIKQTEGLSAKELIELGFDLEKQHKLGTEFCARHTPEIENSLKESGLDKTWGHEGTSLSYATYDCDNIDHEDYGERIISVYSNTKVSNEEIDEIKEIVANAKLDEFNSQNTSTQNQSADLTQ